MSFSQYYGGAIWTNHALARLGARGLSQEMAWKAFQYPEKSLKAKEGASEFIKYFGSSKVSIIAKKNDKNEWVILSCWIDPPLPGSIDIRKQGEYRRYQKMSIWGQLWHDFIKALGF